MFEVLEQNWDVIADEAAKLDRNKILMATTKTRKEIALELIKSGAPQWISGWDGYGEWLNWGIFIEGFCPFGDAGMPKTVALLKQIKGVISYAGISLFKPGTLLRLHSHPENNNLATYHLGLDVPDNCYLCVDGKFIKEQTGRSIVFNGILPHYAFNASDKDRLVLHCEIKI